MWEWLYFNRSLMVNLIKIKCVFLQKSMPKTLMSNKRVPQLNTLPYDAYLYLVINLPTTQFLDSNPSHIPHDFHRDTLPRKTHTHNPTIGFAYTWSIWWSLNDCQTMSNGNVVHWQIIGKCMCVRVCAYNMLLNAFSDTQPIFDSLRRGASFAFAADSGVHLGAPESRPATICASDCVCLCVCVCVCLCICVFRVFPFIPPF